MSTPKPFAFYWRNPGHWDVVSDGQRAFCIRGGAGDEMDDFYVRDERKDERPFPRDNVGPFPTVSAAVSWITETMMQEHDQ